MRHHVHKIKFHHGVDATQSIIHKLVLNFIENGSLKTTLTKAKVLKSLMDRIAFKVQANTTGSKRVLLRTIKHPKMIEKLTRDVLNMSKKQGGFVRIVKTGYRMGDGAATALINWVEPIKKLDEKTKEIKEEKTIKEVAAVTSKKS